MSELILDLSDWTQIAVTGGDRVRFLHGMCTSNIETLKAGGWLRTCFLNHKARILVIAEVRAEEDRLVVSCEPELGDKLFELLDKHIIADDVDIERFEQPMHRVWSDVESVWTAAPVLAAPEESSDPAAAECLRIEAGLPRYGVDLDEANFPFESTLVRLVDYHKGCYTGQEPVARVHARGGANKTLRGLAFEGGLPEPGTAVCLDDKKVGTVSSVCESREHGPIGLSIIRKEAWEPGCRVQVGEQSATVVELPFGSASAASDP